MKDMFLAEFNGPGFALAQMGKRKQKRGETVASFANALENIWSATGENLPQYIKLTQFMEGLDPSIQILVRAQNPGTVTEAIAIAKRVSPSRSHMSYLTQEEVDPMVTGLLAQVADLTKKVEELTTGQQTRSKREYVNIKCDHCGKNGHKEENCWFKNKPRIICHRCNKRGHIAKDCWEKKTKATPSGKGRGRP